jgi:hypothetical protein
LKARHGEGIANTKVAIRVTIFDPKPEAVRRLGLLRFWTSRSISHGTSPTR